MRLHAEYLRTLWESSCYIRPNLDTICQPNPYHMGGSSQMGKMLKFWHRLICPSMILGALPGKLLIVYDLLSTCITCRIIVAYHDNIWTLQARTTFLMLLSLSALPPKEKNWTPFSPILIDFPQNQSIHLWHAPLQVLENEEEHGIEWRAREAIQISVLDFEYIVIDTNALLF